MNTKQTKVAQMVTKAEWIKWKTCKYFDGDLQFTMDKIGDSVFLQGSNLETKDYLMNLFIVQIVIGPRGGIKVKVCEA